MHEMIAHMYENSTGKSVVQSLKEHSENVAELSSKLASNAKLSAVSHMIGLMHDCGKSKKVIQEYIQGKVGRSDGHANPGGRAVAVVIDECCNCHDDNLESILKQLVSMVIASHHTGLKDWSMTTFEKDAPDEEVLRYLNESVNKKEICKLVEDGIKEFKDIKNIIRSSVVHGNKWVRYKLYKYIFGMYARFLLSCQIDADWYDTYIFLNCEKKSEKQNEFSWDLIQEKFELNISKMKSYSDIDLIRSKISEMAYNKGKSQLGCFSLSVPTGAGKTLSSLRFAIEHAKINNLERIIFVIPFCSIIEQTASVIREFLNNSFEECILEDHSREYMRSERDANRDDYVYKIVSERWDCRIIITTAVQYLNIFYSNINRYTRKFNKLSSSVVIFDEVQAIPKKCRQLFNMSVNFLTMSLGSSVLICSATVPEKCKDIIELPNTVDLCANSDLIQINKEVFDRVRIINDLGNAGKGGCRTPEYISKLAVSCMIEAGNCLIIANSKRQVRDIYNNITMQISDKAEFSTAVYFLSTDLCPKHRFDILSVVKDDLKSGKRVILVSTQLIEAGVDIDFNSVVRVVAGADSIVQAAGRCNRNGLLKNSKGEKVYGNVYIVDYINQHKELCNLVDIVHGITISEKILRCDEFSQYINIDNFLNRYNSEYNSEYNDYYFYHYGCREKETIDYLLSEDNGKNFLDMRFKTAGEEFKVIDDDGKYSLFVEYDDYSSELFVRFKNAFVLQNFSKVKSLRRLISLYEISVTKNKYESVIVKDRYDCYKIIDVKTYNNLLKGIQNNE